MKLQANLQVNFNFLKNFLKYLAHQLYKYLHMPISQTVPLTITNSSLLLPNILNIKSINTVLLNINRKLREK